MIWMTKEELKKELKLNNFSNLNKNDIIGIIDSIKNKRQLDLSYIEKATV